MMVLAGSNSFTMRLRCSRRQPDNPDRFIASPQVGKVWLRTQANGGSDVRAAWRWQRPCPRAHLTQPLSALQLLALNDELRQAFPRHARQSATDRLLAVRAAF